MFYINMLDRNMPEYDIPDLENKRPPNHLWVDAMSPIASPKLTQTHKILSGPVSPNRAVFFLRLSLATPPPEPRLFFGQA